MESPWEPQWSHMKDQFRNISEASVLQISLGAAQCLSELLLPPELWEHSMGAAQHEATNATTWSKTVADTAQEEPRAALLEEGM